MFLRLKHAIPQTVPPQMFGIPAAFILSTQHCPHRTPTDRVETGVSRDQIYQPTIYPALRKPSLGLSVFVSEK